MSNSLFIAVGASINICSQIEPMTKLYGVSFIATQFVIDKLKEEGKINLFYIR